MVLSDEIRNWWQVTLLGQQASAHPIFGSAINAEVDGNVVTLTGTVQSIDEVEEVEREVRSLDWVTTVVNHLTVADTGETYRMQTVLAVFPTEQDAEVAQQAISAWTVHDRDRADVFCRRDDATPALQRWVDAAHVPASALARYLEALDEGKVLLVDRAPEDDCLRIISALEGTSAEMIRTLPPESERAESR